MKNKEGKQMGNKERLYSIAPVLLLIFVSSTASAAPVQSNQLMMNETQITTNASDQYNPATYGDRIVWIDWRNEKLDLYMYNLSTSKETPIPINVTMPYNPVIYGDRTVWGDVIYPNEYPLPVIYLYDFSTPKQTQVSASEAAMSPTIYGNRVVWMDDRNNEEGDYLDESLQWRTR